jgi:KRAB domain-containing zinc finger protein
VQPLEENKVEWLAEIALTGAKDDNAVEQEVITEEQIPNFQFLLVTEIVRGRTVVYDRQWMQCIFCRTKFRTKQMMMRHMKDKHSCTTRDPEIQEEIAHAEKNGFKVTLMDMLTYETQAMNDAKIRKPKVPRKVEKQDILGTYPCSQCGKIFSKLRYLRKHMDTHRTEKKAVCDQCGKRFKSRAYLQVHKRVHKEQKVFRCNQCSFTSSNNASIHIHRQVHSQGSVLCDICGFAYNDKSTLNKHKRVHDMSRPFACTFPECRWRFKSETMCKAHIRAHTTEGKFRCSQCGYIFRHKHHLIRHEVNIHNIHRDKSHSAATQAAIESKTENAIEEDPTIKESIMGIIIEPAELASADDLPLDESTLVVTADDQTQIAYETADMTYHTLIQPASPPQTIEVDGIKIEPTTQEILVADTEIQF